MSVIRFSSVQAVPLISHNTLILSAREMLRLIFPSVFVFLLSLTSCYATATTQPPSVQWSIALPLQSGTTIVATDNQGNILAGGQNYLSHIYNSKSYLSKYDSSGSELWQHEFLAQFISGVVVDEEGNIFVTGSQYDRPFFQRPWMGKYSPDGSELWNKVTNYNKNVQSTGLVRSEVGGFYTTGTTYEELGNSEISDRQAILRKLTPEGETSWLMEFGTDADDYGVDVAIDNHENIYVVGHATPILSDEGEQIIDSSFFLNKFDSNGNLIWDRTLDEIGIVQNEALALDTRGNVFVGGEISPELEENSTGDVSTYLSRIDSLGNLIWTRLFNSSELDRIGGLTIGEDGSLFVVGTASTGNPTTGAAVLKKFDVGGELQWELEIGTDFVSGARSDIVFDSSGNIFVSSSLGRITPSSGYIAKLVFPVPEPSSLVSFFVALILIYGNCNRNRTEVTIP